MTGAALLAAALLVVDVDGATVQATIEAATDGDVVEVPAGDWAGPVHVDRAITLRGAGGVIDGGGVGTVVRIEAPGARLERVRLRNSGLDRAGPDSCVYVEPEAVGAATTPRKSTTGAKCLRNACIYGKPRTPSKR